MKRLLSIVLTIFFCMNLLSSMAYAFGEEEVRIDYEDGSYVIITMSSAEARSTKTRTKTYTYYNSAHRRCFAYNLYATFMYNGITSQADSCYADTDFYISGWDIDSHSEYTSGSSAYGDAVFSGPNGESCPISLTLTCDKDGNIT